MLWKLDFDEDFFRICDSKKMVAGYFDPDYGDIHHKENSEQLISSMLKNHVRVPGGLFMIPLVKFRLFDTDLATDILTVEKNTVRVTEHLQKWKSFLSGTGISAHTIRISHTDQDMLTITFPVRFSRPTPLEKSRLLEEISPIFDLLQKSGLL